MKNIFLMSILLLFVCSIAGAVAIPQTYNYQTQDMQWKQTIFNNTNKTICSHTVVTLDMSVASGAYQGFAAYASQKTATGYIAVLGVADTNIASQSLGIITVKGPAQVRPVGIAGTGKEATTSSYPRIGDAVKLSGSQTDLVHPAGSGFSNLGCVVRASGKMMDMYGIYGSIVGYRIGQTTSAGTSNYASSPADDLIWVWIEPTIVPVNTRGTY